MIHFMVMRVLSMSVARTPVGAFHLSRMVMITLKDGGSAAASAASFSIVGERGVEGGVCLRVVSRFVPKMRLLSSRASSSLQSSVRSW